MGHLKSPLTLPVLWYSDAQTELKKLGMEPTEEPEIKRITFYTIDRVFADTYGDGIPCTIVVSAGSEFAVADNLGVINAAIMDKL